MLGFWAEISYHSKIRQINLVKASKCIFHIVAPVAIIEPLQSVFKSQNLKNMLADSALNLER